MIFFLGTSELPGLLRIRRANTFSVNIQSEGNVAQIRQLAASALLIFRQPQPLMNDQYARHTLLDAIRIPRNKALQSHIAV